MRNLVPCNKNGISVCDDCSSGSKGVVVRWGDRGRLLDGMEMAEAAATWPLVLSNNGTLLCFLT